MGKLYDRRRIILNLFKGILDKFPGAVAGYSLRRLSKWKIQLPSEIATPSIAYSLRYAVLDYTGDVIRVRRTSDNAELDFNPTEITDGTLTTWTGSGDGAVTKLYDQSGNGLDVIQATASQQPKVVDTGVLVTKNSLAGIKFDGVDDNLRRNSFTEGEDYVTGPSSVFSVSSVTDASPSDSQQVWGIGGTTANNVIGGTYKNSHFLTAKYNGSSYVFNPNIEASDNTQYVHSLTFDGSSAFNLWGNNISSTGTNNPQFDTTGEVLSIGSGLSGVNWELEGIVQEVIFFDTDQSANRGEIEFNINAYYDIYEQWDGESVAKVRRSSDNAELDFKEKEITDGTLTTWTGSANGFVTTWYDQSGSGNDATQTTASKQPKLVTSGVLNTENGKPLIVPDDETVGFDIPSYRGNSDFWTFNVLKAPTTSAMLLNGDSTDEYLLACISGNTSTTLSSNAGTPVYYEDGSVATYANRGAVFTALSDQSLMTVKADTSSWSLLEIGYSSSGLGMYSMQEMIIYNADKTSDRAGIETNINNHYSIY